VKKKTLELIRIIKQFNINLIEEKQKKNESNLKIRKHQLQKGGGNQVNSLNLV
jgi:hypothetical protein